MIPAEILRHVRRIEFRTKHLVTDVFGGQYHSVFKGRGMEFSEVREYQPGDDVRSIDWNVTARTGHPYVKLFSEERELSVILVVDVSGSGDFGSAERPKGELIAEMCAVLAFSAIRNQDKVGLVLFTDHVERFIPPRKGNSHVLRIIRELLYHPAVGKGTDLSAALEHVARFVRRRSVVVLVSDFLDEGWERAFRAVSARHDVVVLEVSDPREREIPPVGLVRMRDAETGAVVTVDASSREVREAVMGRFARAADERRRLFRSLDVDTARVTTGESYIDPLIRLFRRRAARLRA
jgi:uncharacterized protein (DUF58 family)